MGSTLPRDVWLPRIMDWLSDGRTVATFCRQEGAPQESRLRLALRQWATQSPEVAAELEAAKESGYDAIADDILRIVDDTQGDQDPASRRLRAQMRLELLGRWSRRYNPRQTVEAAGKLSLEVITGVPEPDRPQ